MNGYAYYDTDGMGQPANGNGDANGSVVAGDFMPDQDGAMTRGQSLDDIVNQTAKIMRRQSMPQPQPQQQQHYNSLSDMNMRPGSMMEFGGASPATQMNNFQFDPDMMDHGLMMASPMMNTQPIQQSSNQAVPLHRRREAHRQSGGDLMALSTNFSNTYNAMGPPTSTYTASPAQRHASMDMDMDSSHLDSSLGMPMDYGVDHGMNTAMNLFNQVQYSNQMMTSPMQRAASHARTSVPESRSISTVATSQLQPHSRSQGIHTPLVSSPVHGSNTPRNVSGSDSVQQDIHASFQASATQQTSTMPQSSSPASFTTIRQTAGREQSRTGQDRVVRETPSTTRSMSYDGVNGPLPIDMTNYNPNNQDFPWEIPEGGWPSSLAGRTHMDSMYKNAYSSTGFDMLGVLMRVAIRPNPQISIGSVDLSCAFVVCDVEQDDTPIVYCSDNFERLTGYTKHMILGRNCRFLQSPDGQVSPGIRRKYVDDNSVLYLKNMTNLQREAQISIINYRRGGQPFMNLLTMIPIAWESDKIKFIVGFQVDLVEQPNAVTNKNPDGSYLVNYQRGMTMPRYTAVPAPEMTSKADLGQTVPRDDVSSILATIGSGESEYAKRIWDKVLLENTDDVVHVLSLKGLFQWVSPSASRVLEYEPSELIGTALSSVCHPSDIVPVTRELKDTSSGASVNVVFRIRRKRSGYMWFEGHGSLHTEQGKGRKSIIMVGRERPVYTLSKKDLDDAGGIGENELWTKLSTSGMFLFVASNVRQLLDRQPDELVGVSIQTLMRSESKTEFGRILEYARRGKVASVKHEMINRRGQVLSAYTTVYPGDAQEGQKPTFVLAQTRLIKFSRNAQPARVVGGYSRFERNVREASVTNVQVLAKHGGSISAETSESGMSASHYMNTDGAAATYSGQFGLEIGHQDQSLASEDNLFDELKTTKSSSWQYEIRQLEKQNRTLAEEVQSLMTAKKKRKRRKGAGSLQKDCANCHTKVTPEWRRGPSGRRDLCNSCGLRFAKLNGRVSPKTTSVYSGGATPDRGSRTGASPIAGHGYRSTPATAPKAEFPPTTAPTAVFGGAGGEPDNSPAKDGPPPNKAARLSSGGDHSASMEGASGVPDSIEEDIEPD